MLEVLLARLNEGVGSRLGPHEGREFLEVMFADDLMCGGPLEDGVHLCKLLSQCKCNIGHVFTVVPSFVEGTIICVFLPDCSSHGCVPLMFGCCADIVSAVGRTTLSKDAKQVRPCGKVH